MYEGNNGILIPLLLSVALGFIVLFGAYYARRNGHLQSRGARMAALAVIVVLAIIVWVGPGLFLASEL